MSRGANRLSGCRLVITCLFSLWLVPGCAVTTSPANVGPTPGDGGPAALPAAVGGDKPEGSAMPVPRGAFLFYEDFERPTAVAQKWEVPDPTTAVTWRLFMSFSCGGLYTMALGRSGLDPFRSTTGEAFLTLREPIDLKKAVHPILKYDVKGVAFPATALAIIAQVRDGAGPWTSVGEVATGHYVFMGTVLTDLKAYAGRAIGLRMRAALAPSDDVSKGLLLDDIEVIEPN